MIIIQLRNSTHITNTFQKGASQKFDRKNKVWREERKSQIEIPSNFFVQLDFLIFQHSSSTHRVFLFIQPPSFSILPLLFVPYSCLTLQLAPPLYYSYRRYKMQTAAQLGYCIRSSILDSSAWHCISLCTCVHVLLRTLTRNKHRERVMNQLRPGVRVIWKRARGKGVLPPSWRNTIIGFSE